MKINTQIALLKSLSSEFSGLVTIEEVMEKVKNKNTKNKVRIKKVGINECLNWKISDLGYISNLNGSFFSIRGIRYNTDNVSVEQPIIIQDEIGYLGFITKDFDGILHFLVQFKIEPGNVNKIQLSPTIQATRSNFTQKHGGRKPEYLDYFLNSRKYEIIVDQIQSEQSSRFYKKRNRNVIIKIEEDINVEDSHIWLTLHQLKTLMKVDNLVNMDTRTVLSCIPFLEISSDKIDFECFRDNAQISSMFGSVNFDELHEVFNRINDFKMSCNAQHEFVSLRSLTTWEINENELISKQSSSFKVIFCEIEIEGREVRKWYQPLFEAIGMAYFGLLTSVKDGIRKYLVRIQPEIGSFDFVELGPTVQHESDHNRTLDFIEKEFYKNYESKKGILYDVILSEEGGRFYHEQNRNIILEIEYEYFNVLPENYMWVEYKTLNYLLESNNYVNIQLRNLLSLMEV